MNYPTVYDPFTWHGHWKISMAIPVYVFLNSLILLLGITPFYEFSCDTLDFC